MKNSEEFVSGVTQNNSLDLLKPNSNKPIPAPCKSKDFSLVSEESEKDLFSYFRTFCKSYRCEYCGPRKALLMRSLIQKALIDRRLNVFASLTLDPRSCEAVDSAKYIKKTWNKFRILQKRKFGKGLEYIQVLEFQKSGYAHLHVLFDSFVDQKWLASAWHSVGGGSIVDIRRADEAAPKYLTKYLVKTLTLYGGKGFRLISTSKGIRLKEYLSPTTTNYEFLKITQTDARKILRHRIHEDIQDRRGFIQGFKADKKLKVQR